MERDRPVPEAGKFVGPMVDAKGIITKHRFPLGQAESLAVLQEEWAFFTPAVLYVHGKFTDAYLIDYMFDIQEDVPLYFYRFQAPVFAGLESRSGDKGWNFALWAVHLEYWETLLDFICSVSIANRDDKQMWRFGLQELTILDPVRVERAKILTPELPLVTVGAFGMYGSQGQAYFTQKPANPFIPPRLTFAKPDDKDVVFARAYFDGKNPINAKDLFLQQKLKEDNQ